MSPTACLHDADDRLASSEVCPVASQRSPLVLRDDGVGELGPGARFLLLLLYFRFLPCLILPRTFLYSILFLLLPFPFLVTLLGSRFGHAQSSSTPIVLFCLDFVAK